MAGNRRTSAQPILHDKVPNFSEENINVNAVPQDAFSSLGKRLRLFGFLTARLFYCRETGQAESGYGSESLMYLGSRLKGEHMKIAKRQPCGFFWRWSAGLVFILVQCRGRYKLPNIIPASQADWAGA